MTFRSEKHASGTHVLGLTTNGHGGSVAHDFKGEAKFKALVFSLFGHDL
jgi:hypothetical protein